MSTTARETPTTTPAVPAPFGATVLRLRPVVHATPTGDGVHVRGANSSFTVSGGPAVWRLWQALARSLTEGHVPGPSVDLSENPAVQRAVASLVTQLHEHDMLVRLPPEWGESEVDGGPPVHVARWLATVADDPVRAWSLLAAAHVQLDGAGTVTESAVRALTGAGIRVTRTPLRPASTVDGPAVLRAGAFAIAADASNDVAIVTAVQPPATVGADIDVIRDRVHQPAVTEAPVEAPRVLGALAGAAAAHRLVCALAALPDPGRSTQQATTGPAAGIAGELPTVLIGRLDPLRATYHPWLGAGGSADPDREDCRPIAGTPAFTVAGTAGRVSLSTALATVEVLCDAELGVLPPVEMLDLPQLPAGLARCDVPGIVVVGTGTNADMARLGAAAGAAERVLAASATLRPAGDMVAVGADRLHAEGMLLRRLVHRMGPDTGTLVDSDHWGASPQVRRWWKALTLRFGIAAEMVVRRVEDGVFQARVFGGGTELGWAVERTAADAAAFAALSAVGLAQWRDHHGADAPDDGGSRVMRVQPPAGCVPPIEPTPVRDGPAWERAPWLTGQWIWPADAADREEALQASLRANTTARVAQPRPGASALLGALATVGFVVVAA